ncbi:MAG: WbqC family protein [Ghiorsea sp.]
MPWPGFFHKWMIADVFVVLDTVQYHKNEWQNRNRIKTTQGEQWVTVPVNYRFPQRIEEVGIVQSNWAKKQISSIEQAYAKSPFLADYWEPIKRVLQKKHVMLTDLNTELIQTFGQLLGCNAPLHLASDLPISHDDPTQRLITLTKHFDGDTYLSGSEGRNYLENEAFTQERIQLMFQNVAPPTYQQLHGDFIPYLSVLDVLLNMGEDSKEIIATMGDMQP